jgi:hypothetical protein
VNFFATQSTNAKFTIIKTHQYNRDSGSHPKIYGSGLAVNEKGIIANAINIEHIPKINL